MTTCIFGSFHNEINFIGQKVFLLSYFVIFGWVWKNFPIFDGWCVRCLLSQVGYFTHADSGNFPEYRLKREIIYREVVLDDVVL